MINITKVLKKQQVPFASEYPKLMKQYTTKKIEIKSVPINSIYVASPITPDIIRGKLQTSYNNKLPIILRKDINGKLHLYDGSHRIVEHILGGKSNIKALIIYGNKIEKGFPIGKASQNRIIRLGNKVFNI